jgi:dihydropteroate synthase
MRPHFQWNLGRRSLALGDRTLVMGVLNVTPDSFSDGGRHLAPEAAIAHALALLDEGADILDIGGESTRPGTPVASPSCARRGEAVSALEELDRVLPVVEALRRKRPEAVLSIDTYKSEVARAAVDAGAEIVNDVSGLAWDAAMATTVAEAGCGLVLMHTRGTPEEWASLPPLPDPLPSVRDELAVRAAVALTAGFARESIVVDPGFGFGKRGEENFSLLARFGELGELGFPLLAGLSRKSFLASAMAGRPVNPADRDAATLAASVAAVLAGAHIVRVHAVRAAVEAMAVADAILRARTTSP